MLDDMPEMFPKNFLNGRCSAMAAGDWIRGPAVVFAAALAAVLSLFCLPALAYKPLFENVDNLALENNRLLWSVWVPGESDDGVAWSPLFHESVRYWDELVPYFSLSAVNRDSRACAGGSSRNGINTVTWRDTNCGGFAMPGSAGWAPTFYSGIGEARAIDEGDIFFNEMFEHADGGTEQMVFDEISFYSVALHEIGHNLGLGHGMFNGATMAYGPTHRWHSGLSPDDICGVAVISGHREHCPVALGEAVATDGRETEAHFSGYASADAGATARELLRPWQEFNIYATVLIDPAHRYHSGQLHVAGQTEDGRIFARDAEGAWHLYEGGELPAANTPGILGHAMELVILGRNGVVRGTPTFDQRHGYRLYRDAMTGIRLNLEGVSLKFWVAYSSDLEPGLLIYGNEPIHAAWTWE